MTTGPRYKVWRDSQYLHLRYGGWEVRDTATTGHPVVKLCETQKEAQEWAYKFNREGQS